MFGFLVAVTSIGACKTEEPDAGTPLPLSVKASPKVPPYVPPVPQPVPHPVDLPAVILDFAGSGAIGDAGDGGLAVDAQFRSLGGVAVGSDGMIYLSDPSASRIRRIHPSGLIEAVAGTGKRGYSGDGGYALAAALTDPSRLTVDQGGILFVAELDRVRRIDPSGLISTVLGDGQPGRDGDGGPAFLARTSGNAGMAIDGEGNLFIAERSAHRIRRVDTQGYVTTVAGTGVPGSDGDGGPPLEATLNQPVDVEIDDQGNVLIAELAGNRIRRISGKDGLIGTIIGRGGRAGRGGDGGAAVDAELNGPQSVAVDASGAILVADWNNRLIRRVDRFGVIRTIAGMAGGRIESGELAVESRLTLPMDIAPTLDGRLLVIEQGARRVRTLAPVPKSEEKLVTEIGYVTPMAALPHGVPIPDDAIATHFAGSDPSSESGHGIQRLDAAFASPRGITIDAFGRLLIADTGNHQVRRIGRDGTVETVAGTGAPGFSGDGGSATSAQLNRPSALVVDTDGALYIADTGNFRIRKVDPSGVITTLAGSAQPGAGGDGGPARNAQFTELVGLALDSQGALYVVDAPIHRVRVIGVDGVIRPFAGSGIDGRSGDGGPAIEAALGFPQRVAIAPDGSVLITQLHEGAVRRVGIDGVIDTLAGFNDSGVTSDKTAKQDLLDKPVGVVVDSSGNVYVVESGFGEISRVSPDGTIRVIAGNPRGDGGSGGAARDVRLDTARELVLGSDGSAYLLESNGLIWRLGSNVLESETPPALATSTPESQETQVAAKEAAEVATVVLALELGEGQVPIGPTLEFHPGERVNVAVKFVDVLEGSRLGIRWFAGDAQQGIFLTKPQPGFSQAQFGFWFVPATAKPEGPWRVEILVGSTVLTSVDFVVVPGEIRIDPSRA